MTEQPKEYIITEDQIKGLSFVAATNPISDCDKVLSIISEIYSRPVSTSPERAASEPTHCIHECVCSFYENRKGVLSKEPCDLNSLSACPHSNSGHDDAAIEQAAREKVLGENMALIRDVISKDQSGLAEALAKIRTLAKGYDWIPDGEWGSYDYTQRTVETLQKECGYLLAEIEKIAYEGLRDSGNRVIAHVQSCEESLISNQLAQKAHEPESFICANNKCLILGCIHRGVHQHNEQCDRYGHTTCQKCVPVKDSVSQPSPVPTSGTGTALEGATVEHMQTERTCKICKHPTCPQRTTSSNAYKVCIADGSFVDKEPEQDECTYPGMAKDIEDLCGRVKILEERVDTNDRSIL